MSSAISYLVHNLPPLPSCELTNPHDDVTLPRLIEALQNRHRIRQMMFDEYSKAGADHILAQSSALSFASSGHSKSFVSCLGSHVSFPYVFLADMMKSMIQEADKKLISTDSVIHEQNSKLVDKDRIIQNNKAEMVRLEKTTETQEHKVKDKIIQTSWKVLIVDVLLSALKVTHVYVPD